MRVLRPPLVHAEGNLLYGPDLRDPWALYRLETRSYPGLPTAQKVELKDYLEAFAYRVGADFQVLRVSRELSLDEYFRGAARTLDPRRGHLELWAATLGTHCDVLKQRRAVRPECYLAARLRDPTRSMADALADRPTVRELLDNVAAAVGLRDPRGMRRAQIEAHRALEHRTFERVFSYLDCERASTDELQWLIRRAYTRGMGEPRLDAHWRPQALSFVAGDGTEAWVPSEAEFLRLHDARVTIGARQLVVDGEQGRACQALLVVGALPESCPFPGADAELLFAPLEQLDFPVDAAFSCRWVPNRDALALARRRKVDADNDYDEQTLSVHGPNSESAARPSAARELEERLAATDRPPLLRGGIVLAVGAPDERTLEERIERLRAEYGRIELHRPVGEQHRLFLSVLPAQHLPVRDYAEHLLAEQFAAMVPIAANVAGSERGPYIGHTISGSRQPILLDLAEAAQRSRPPTVLIAGTLGSGKTLLLQLLCWHAFQQGSRIVDVDPKGDHHLDRLPGVEEHLEAIELTASPRWRGLLDPLRVGARDALFDLTTSFLCELLPRRRDGWVIAIQEAVKATIAAAQGDERRATCGEVLARLLDGDEEAVGAARALAVHADSGLAQLGFAAPDSRPQRLGGKQVTSVRIRNLPRPAAGLARTELTEEERIGQAVLRLLANFAMHLAGRERREHKVVAFDESWFLLQGSVGQRLLEQLSRWGRSENATPILCTHLVSDAEHLDNLIGPRFVMGMESEEEARRALALLRLDADDDGLRQRLIGFRRGRCLFRDGEGRTVQMQVDPADSRVLAELDTTPNPKRKTTGRRTREGRGVVAA